MKTIHPDEITPEEVYLSRRRFMKGVGAIVAGGALVACGRTAQQSLEGESIGLVPPSDPLPTHPPAATPPVEPKAGDVAAQTDELGDQLTDFESVTNYNNFYEFSTDKQSVAPLSVGFPTSPWQVEIGGLVSRPGTYDLDDLRAFDREERIYRLRCVEGWSMVIPWLGFPLAKLLEKVEPTSDAKFVRFETIHAPADMPGQQGGWFDWPYVEGLRIDEAMNDLAILATGLYGKDLLPQNGAPVRLVVPWKYGFKSVKSIVKIDLVAEQPTTFWMDAAPNEYGFYANVNPEVDHPRWSQATERRIGEFRRRRTLMFNGYEEQVAHLYEGLDLRANF